MSFIMIAAGPTSCSRVRTLSVRSLLFASGLAGLGLVAAGGGLEQQLALAADAAALQNLALMRLPTRLPVDADVVSSFGNREDPFTGRHAFHAGLDFAAEKGTAIHAAAGGTVAVAGFRSDFGWV